MIQQRLSFPQEIAVPQAQLTPSSAARFHNRPVTVCASQPSNLDSQCAFNSALIHSTNFIISTTHLFKVYAPSEIPQGNPLQKKGRQEEVAEK